MSTGGKKGGGGGTVMVIKVREIERQGNVERKCEIKELYEMIACKYLLIYVDVIQNDYFS